MTRLGHVLTILTLALAPATAGSAFAQTTEIPRAEITPGEIPRIEIPQIVTPGVDVPRVDIPRIEIPRLAFPRMELPQLPKFDAFDAPQFNFEMTPDVGLALEKARAFADMAEVGKFAQGLSDQQRDQIDAARDMARGA